jgi:hypothetical protein
MSLQTSEVGTEDLKGHKERTEFCRVLFGRRIKYRRGPRAAIADVPSALCNLFELLFNSFNVWSNEELLNRRDSALMADLGD